MASSLYWQEERIQPARKALVRDKLLAAAAASAAAAGYTGWSKKRGHSTFSQISRKLLKISK